MVYRAIRLEKRVETNSPLCIKSSTVKFSRSQPSAIQNLPCKLYSVVYKSRFIPQNGKSRSRHLAIERA